MLHIHSCEAASTPPAAAAAAAAAAAHNARHQRKHKRIPTSATASKADQTSAQLTQQQPVKKQKRRLSLKLVQVPQALQTSTQQ
jgi:hypothetical protein